MPGTTTANGKQKTAVGFPKLKQMETSTPQAFLSQAESLLLKSTAPVTLITQTPFCTKLQDLSSNNYYSYTFLFNSVAIK